jgi:hypothetical protein
MLSVPLVFQPSSWHGLPSNELPLKLALDYEQLALELNLSRGFYYAPKTKEEVISPPPLSIEQRTEEIVTFVDQPVVYYRGARKRQFMNFDQAEALNSLPYKVCILCRLS